MKNKSHSLPPCFKLYAEGTIAQNEDVLNHFIGQFNESWAGLPNDDIAIIQTMTADGASQIELQLRDRHHSLQEGPSGSATAQMIYDVGQFEIIFDSRYAQKLSDAACRCWIAHELAHVYLCIKDPSHGSCYSTAEEEVATLLVDRWGFGKEEESKLNVEVFLIKNDVSE